MRALLALLLILFNAAPALPHSLDPGYLDLREDQSGIWRIYWRVPDVGGRAMPIQAMLPADCEQRQGPSPSFDGRAWASVWVTACDNGMRGNPLVIEGLEKTRTDALVRFSPRDGTSQTHRLTSAAPRITLTEAQGPWQVFAAYVGLGVEHILQGLDHLLFVFALMLLIRDWRRLLLAITAFTVAHSITLISATLGWLYVPAPPVEAVIALSIVFLAYELAKPPDRRDALAQNFPWLISFGFGLIHGLGFAGALRDIGLPPGDIPLALLAFNVGVELGQIAFLAVSFVVLDLARRILGSILPSPARMTLVASYCIGSIASFWMFERISGF